MRNLSTSRSADWHYINREADNTLVVLDKPKVGAASGRHYVTNVNVSFDSTGSAEVNIAGLATVNDEADSGEFGLDFTDVGLVKLATEVFTVAGHTFANGDKVLLNLNGGTTITGLLDYTAYWIVGVSTNDFQLSLTKGGSAIALSGTQAGFAASADIMRVAKAFYVYDHAELDFDSPLKGAPNRDLIITVGAVASVQGCLNVSGYT